MRDSDHGGTETQCNRGTPPVELSDFAGSANLSSGAGPGRSPTRAPSGCRCLVPELSGIRHWNIRDAFVIN